MKEKKTSVPAIWILLAFGAIYFVWGTTYLANIYALKAISPFMISALRYLIAGVLLALLAYVKKQAFPDKLLMRDLSISGILMLVGGSGLVVVAEQYISSGSAAVIVATEPLWFVLLDRRRWKLYFSNKKIMVGLLIGFVGIVLFAHFATSTSNVKEIPDHQLEGMLIVLGGCVLWVVGTLFSSRSLKSSGFNLWHTTIQLLAGGAFSALICLLNGEWKQFSFQSVSLESWGGLAFLVAFGSLIAYLAFAWLITVQPPAIVSTHTYVNPLIAVFIGWLVAGEKITWPQFVALGIALTGVIITQVNKENANAQT